MKDLFSKYGYVPDMEKIGRSLDVIAANVEGLASPQVIKQCFAAMDVTTLHTEDTPQSVAKLTCKVNDLAREYPGYPMPASICVFPNFASVVRDTLEDNGVRVTTVAGCFPSSQSYLEVKVRECALAVENGADEVDIVLALNSFLSEDFDAASSEIRAMRAAVDEAGKKVGRKVVLKVILETGLLVSAENIANASFLAMEAGADFIKTSTGKVSVNATPVAAYVMCSCIKAFFSKTGRKVGFKAAGGISSTLDAVSYYSIVSTLLGKDWLGRDGFRLGVSRLANSLISSVEQKTVTYF